MTNLEIKNELSNLVVRERGLTIQILKLIQVGLKQRSFLEFGFASMFDWLTKGFGYSNAAAYRRIEAARISLLVPEVTEKIEQGRINLSNLCSLQTAIKNEERARGVKIDIETQKRLVEKIEGKSAPEVEREIVTALPSAQLNIRQDRRVRIDAATIRHSLNLSESVANDLQRAKEVLSHKLPNASDADVIAEVLKYFLDKRDPLRRPIVGTSAAEVKREVLRVSDGCCTYQDPLTGHRCGSRFQVEVDHIVPRATGGSNAPENLRALCRQHNLLMAEKILGVKTMARFRN